MIQDRLNDKEHDIRGVQKQSSELLSIAWQKGYQAGFDDGYATRREAEIIPQGEINLDELCRLRSDLKTGAVVGSTLRYQYQIDRYIKAIDNVIGANMKGGAE